MFYQFKKEKKTICKTEKLFEFFTLTKLTEVHKNKKPFTECNVCFTKFNEKMFLNPHVPSVHGRKKFPMR